MMRIVIVGGARPTIQFADGLAESEADLLIGADGVKSVVKKFITGDGQTDEQPAYYVGLTGVGGFIPSSYLPENEPRGRMRVTFGAHGFFGNGACSIAPQSKYFADCTAPMGDEAAWWTIYETADVPDSRRFDPVTILDQLKERHTGWTDPVIRQTVNEAVITSISPTWITPELPTWYTRGRAILDLRGLGQTLTSDWISIIYEGIFLGFLVLLLALDLSLTLNPHQDWRPQYACSFDGKSGFSTAAVTQPGGHIPWAHDDSGCPDDEDANRSQGGQGSIIAPIRNSSSSDSCQFQLWNRNKADPHPQLTSSPTFLVFQLTYDDKTEEEGALCAAWSLEVWRSCEGDGFEGFGQELSGGFGNIFGTGQ
ncbi:MAG: hypothetical protein Q9177_004710 [Variospora cf. flavescens]